MTKHTKDAHISDSASGGKGESMAREIRKRAEEWLRSILEMDGYTATATDKERIEVLLIECSRLASRVEELEKLIAKHSGSLNSADSASNTESSSTAKETRKG